MPVRERITPNTAKTQRRGGAGAVSGRMTKGDKEAFLQEVYRLYHHARFISPDPLELVYRYEDQHDREIAGLIASSLAYGRVSQILRSAEAALSRMGPSPRAYLEDTGVRDLREDFRGFRHRFTTGEELADLLVGARRVIRRYGSLGACFTSGVSARDDTVLPALASFVRELDPQVHVRISSLLPDPARGSACKRLHLYLRWMVRSDEIDPGGWTGVSPAKLVIPLDTHMYRICSSLGMTSRAQADGKTVLEITEGFRLLSPHDPVRYDFSLTRMGMRGESGRRWRI